MARDLVDLLLNPDEHTLQRFVAHWHGTTIERVSASDEEPLALAELRALHAANGQIIVQNHLSAAEPLPDGKVIFYVENQGCYEWAYLPGSADPQVFGRFEPEDPWVAEREPLSRFVLEVALFEAQWAASHGGTVLGLGHKELDEILRGASLVELPLGPWRWPTDPSRFYASDDLIVITSAEGPRDDEALTWELSAGARTREAVERLAPFVNDRWDYFSLRDGGA